MTNLNAIILLGLEIIDFKHGVGDTVRDLALASTRPEIRQHFQNVYVEWNDGEDGEDWSPLLAAVNAWVGNAEAHLKAMESVRLATTGLEEDIFAAMTLGIMPSRSDVVALRRLSLTAVAPHAHAGGDWIARAADHLCEQGVAL